MSSAFAPGPSASSTLKSTPAHHAVAPSATLAAVTMARTRSSASHSATALSSSRSRLPLMALLAFGRSMVRTATPSPTSTRRSPIAAVPEVHPVAVRRPPHVEREFDPGDGAGGDVVGVEDVVLASRFLESRQRHDDIAVAFRGAGRAGSEDRF